MFEFRIYESLFFSCTHFGITLRNLNVRISMKLKFESWKLFHGKHWGFDPTRNSCDLCFFFKRAYNFTVSVIEFNWFSNVSDIMLMHCLGKIISPLVPHIQMFEHVFLFPNFVHNAMKLIELYHKIISLAMFTKNNRTRWVKKFITTILKCFVIKTEGNNVNKSPDINSYLTANICICACRCLCMNIVQYSYIQYECLT